MAHLSDRICGFLYRVAIVRPAPTVRLWRKAHPGLRHPRRGNRRAELSRAGALGRYWNPRNSRIPWLRCSRLYRVGAGVGHPVPGCFPLPEERPETIRHLALVVFANSVRVLAYLYHRRIEAERGVVRRGNAPWRNRWRDCRGLHPAPRVRCHVRDRTHGDWAVSPVSAQLECDSSAHAGVEHGTAKTHGPGGKQLLLLVSDVEGHSHKQRYRLREQPPGHRRRSDARARDGTMLHFRSTSRCYSR